RGIAQYLVPPATDSFHIDKLWQNAKHPGAVIRRFMRRQQENTSWQIDPRSPLIFEYEFHSVLLPQAGVLVGKRICLGQLGKKKIQVHPFQRLIVKKLIVTCNDGSVSNQSTVHCGSNEVAGIIDGGFGKIWK